MPDKPVRSELEWFYNVEKLSTHRIGAIYGFPHVTICRWMKKLGIKRRPAGRGLSNRGLAEPTKEHLYALVHLEHKSYEEIGRIFAVNSRAILYWIDKHEIPRPKIWETRRKGKEPIYPTPDELRNLYEVKQLSTSIIGGQYGLSGGTIKKLCDRFGIEVRPDGFNGGNRIRCSDDHLVRSTYEQRVCEWLYERGIAHEYEPQLPFDRRYHADFLVGSIFIEIWGIVGSAGYNARVKRKQAMYRTHKAQLIELPCHAFNTSHRNLWCRRLEPLISTPVQSVLDPSQIPLFAPQPLV